MSVNRKSVKNGFSEMHGDWCAFSFSFSPSLRSCPFFFSGWRKRDWQQKSNCSSWSRGGQHVHVHFAASSRSTRAEKSSLSLASLSLILLKNFFITAGSGRWSIWRTKTKDHVTMKSRKSLKNYKSNCNERRKICKWVAFRCEDAVRKWWLISLVLHPEKTVAIQLFLSPDLVVYCEIVFHVYF